MMGLNTSPEDIPGVLSSPMISGSFQLVQAVHRWHTDFENRWTDEVCYLVACIIPIYAAAFTVDTIFFNSVEFWIDKNPINNIQTANATVTRLNADTLLVKSNATGETFTLTRQDANTYTLTDAQGNALACSVQGSLLTMTDAQGNTRTALL